MTPQIATATSESFSATATTAWSSVWHARWVMLGAVSIVTGILWDISWHRTIGRDSFWTPAHMAIYLGGILGGCIGGWLVIRGTLFASDEEKSGMVSVLGFRGPLGAFICIWGALAMLTSAPFDDWWHGAYGLDVKILSPPHTVLAMGMWGIVVGALLLVLREQNAAFAARDAAVAEAETMGGTEEFRSRFELNRWLFVVAGGILVAMAAVFLIEESWPNQHRSALFYQMSCATYPLYLMALSRASQLRFGATIISAVYMLIFMLQGWLLPLFAGEPKLGPVYNREVDHFVPLAFPLLLVVPALGMDLVRWLIGAGRGRWRDWSLAVLSAVAFTVLFFVTQYAFSAFLISDAAENRFFFTDLSWGYTERPGPWRNEYWNETGTGWSDPAMLKGLAWALLWSLVTCRVGLWIGNWMTNVKR